MKKTYRKILIAVDGSICSTKAVKKGIQLGVELNAAIALIYVVDDSFVPLGTDETYGSPITILNEMREEGISVLDKLSSKAETKVEKFLEVGKPFKEILNKARMWKADLIVMGTHGRTGLKHLLMGSVAEHVIRNSKLPVFIVPIT